MKNQKNGTIELNLEQYQTIISALVGYANNCAANRTHIYNNWGECPAYESWGHQLSMADDIAFKLEKAGASWQLDKGDVVKVAKLDDGQGQGIPAGTEIREQVEKRLHSYSSDVCANLDVEDFHDDGEKTSALYAAHALGMYDAMRMLANWIDGVNRAPF